jgi:NADPH:quinone reductase-like Zn-dependent oxidoreductase
MKALTLKRYGSLANATFEEISRPVIGPDEILVEIYAAGLNPIDYMIPKGTFKPILKFDMPATLGSDLAGVVVEVGNKVTRFKVGDEVFASIFDLGRGSLAEYAAVPEFAAALKPSNLSFAEAASIPMVGLTSWQALGVRAQTRPGHKVFIPAGSGGIGTFAIQLAKQLGATVGTTTSTGNIEWVRALGADEVVDYKKQNFEEVLRGYDTVLGTVRGDALEKALRILKPKSKVVSLIGPPDGAFASQRGMNLLMKIIFRLLSGKISRLAKRQDSQYSFLFVQPNGDHLAIIGSMLEAERIRPVIDRVFSFENAKLGLEYLEAGRAKGKVVVELKNTRI